MIIAKGTLTNASPSSDAFVVEREILTVAVHGTFGGATVKMQDSPPEDPKGQIPEKWYDTDDVTGSADYRKNIRLAEGGKGKLVLTGGSGSTVYYVVYG